MIEHTRFIDSRSWDVCECDRQPGSECVWCLLVLSRVLTALSPRPVCVCLCVPVCVCLTATKTTTLYPQWTFAYLFHLERIIIREGKSVCEESVCVCVCAGLFVCVWSMKAA